MKKKILFIISNMESGGVSKSMSSLLNVIDTARYDIDCFILHPKGIFIDSIPKQINIISDYKTALFFLKFPKNIVDLLKNGYFYDALIRMVAGLLMQINRGWGGYLLSKRIYKVEHEYDLAIDYNGQHQLYYLIDSIKAKKKITFFHSDYEKWSYYYSMDKKYMPKADFIYTISERCLESLIKFFPGEKSKMGCFNNISPLQTIIKMSCEAIEDKLDPSVVKLISIGHVSINKGSDLALKAAQILKNSGIQFKWYFVGKKQDDPIFDQIISKGNLSNEIVFLGLKSNPYPYIEQADIVVHTSLFEGKSIALDEAKILAKPIVVTNFSTVYDQFTDRINASICTMNEDDIASKIKELIVDSDLRKKYISNLEVNRVDNSNEIEKLYKHIDNL
ncbi:MAG: glycosyltransferase [Aequorivita sp.]